jgi:hypothetical protein
MMTYRPRAALIPPIKAEPIPTRRELRDARTMRHSDLLRPIAAAVIRDQNLAAHTAAAK